MAEMCYFCNKEVLYPDGVRTRVKHRLYHVKCIRWLRDQKNLRRKADMKVR